MPTKKHFVFIAETIRTMDITIEERAAIANRFAEKFAEANPRFDRERFLLAALECK